MSATSSLVGIAPSITPVIPAPPGIDYNFVNPDSQRAAIIVTAALMISFTTFFVGLRLYINATVNRVLKADDCKTASVLQMHVSTDWKQTYALLQQ